MVLKCVLCSALAFVAAAYSGRFSSHVSAGQCSGPSPTQSKESLALVQRHASALTSTVQRATVHEWDTTAIRLYYNDKTGDHFYSKSTVTPGGYGWLGVDFHAFATQVAGTVPIRLYYNDKTGDHFYSQSAHPPAGYGWLGVDFYAFATQVAGTVPINRFYASSTGDHFYSKTKEAPSWVHWVPYGWEGVAFYAYAGHSYLPTQSPTQSPTLSPTLSPTQDPTKSPTHAVGCQSWCEPSSRAWATKCEFNACLACTSCADHPGQLKPGGQFCEGWCKLDPRPWTTKCNFKRKCGDCHPC
jgi:hypothetical protein